MKRLLIVFFVLLTINLYASPDNSMSITPVAVDGAVITASDENTRNNAVSAAYNVHDHTDISRTANTLNVGDGAAGAKTITAYNADTNKAYLRYNDTLNEWIVSTDGLATSILLSGGEVTFEGLTNDTIRTTLKVTDPTANRTITFPDQSGQIPLGTVGYNLTLTTTATTNVTLPTSGIVVATPTGDITNASVNATAAIVDTKLAAITTASKVNGTALIGLANTPSGAGVLPVVNLGSGTANNTTVLVGNGTWSTGIVPLYKIGNFTVTNTTTSVIVTGVGFTPKIIQLFAAPEPATLTPGFSQGWDDGTTHLCMYVNTSATTIAAGYPLTYGYCIRQSTGQFAYGNVTSLNNDGFNMTVFSNITGAGNNGAEVIWMAQQ